MRTILPFCLVTLLSLAPALAANPESEALVLQGNAAFKKGDRAGAISFFTQAITADPSNVIAYYNRGRIHDTEARYDQALPDYDQLLKLQPDHVKTLLLRGGLHLRLGHIDEALADFDRYLKLDPKQEPHHWLRGIALYFADRYEESRRQFESHHKVNTNDVETAVWHFLCVTRASGFDTARASLLPVGKDWRAPLNQVHLLFAGKLKPDDVIAAAKVGNPGTNAQSHPLFFAHYYVGLYYEAAGESQLALEHIDQAITRRPRGEYMGDIAKVHAAWLRKRSTSAPKP